LSQLEQRNVADLYLQDAVENAPPVKLVRMLVEGAVRFLDRAIATSPKADRRAFVNWCQRADAIVVELRLALAPAEVNAEGADVAPKLESLYIFCEGRIGQALIDQSNVPLVEARGILATLLDAWQRIETPQGTDSAA
jgi:flagellar protein FliS